jgi:glycosyltransferase involved in cell wall biosynthesis
MRLALVNTTPHGGLLHYGVQLGDAMAERGHSVDVVVPEHNELHSHRGAARMRPVLAPPERSTKAPPSGVAYQLRRAGIALRLVRTWGRIMRDARFGGYDVLVLNADVALSLTASLCLVLTAIPGRPPIALVCHNAVPYNRFGGEEMYESSPVLLGLLRRLYPRLELVLLHGEKSRADFEDAWPPSRLAIIPHGDERLFGDEPPPPASEERILFFGDWRKVKGLEVLMEAFDELVLRRPSVRLTIAGTPAPQDLDPEVVHRWAASRRERVEVIDRYIPMEDVREIFARARVVATPYYVAFQSGVAHLAQTMARPVVASDAGDLPSAVSDGRTGRVVPAGDARALAAALEEVVSDGDLAERLGCEGNRRLENEASWEKVAERLEEHLLAVVPGGRG